MIAEGDKVMCRNIWRWTDTGSGKKMQFHGFVLWRFEGDKIAERWATVGLRRSFPWIACGRTNHLPVYTHWELNVCAFRRQRFCSYHQIGGTFGEPTHSATPFAGATDPRPK
jgi:hypothetical protein